MRHAGVTRCPWCGARNYTIDTWCSRCEHFLDWAPPGRRYHRGRAALSAIAAVIGVSLAVALPVAGWSGGSWPAVSFAIPSFNLKNLDLAPPASRSQPEAIPAPDASPQPDLLPAAASPASEPSQLPVAPRIGEPTDAVSRFYRAISAHQFDVAASLWTAQLREQNPPTLFIDQRFAMTDRIDVGDEHLLSAGDGTATVYVDVVEVTSGLNRRWVGTWQVVDTAFGWLLNGSDLRPET